MINTALGRTMGLDIPLFAFTRSKEVVAAVTRAGGLGVLGAIAHTPEQLDADCTWLDEACGGRAYGVDTVMPQSYAGKGEDWDEAKLQAMISDAHRAFVEGLLARFGVPPLPEGYQRRGEDLLGWSVERGMQHLEVALRHRVSLIANALGTPPPEAIEAAHAAGVKVAALCGKVDQAVGHAKAGVDIIVAQGTEAGGHTGEVSTMVLVPEIVDAVGDVPVLAAGGIGTGRQFAASLCLGAQGAWTGSIWLTTAEHVAYHAPIVLERLLEARSTDTVRSRAISGKPARQIRNAWTDAWEAKGSPGTLPVPLQWMVQAEAVERIYQAGCKPLACSPVGQIVGRMNAVRPAGDLVAEMWSEAQAVLGRLGGV